MVCIYIYIPLSLSLLLTCFVFFGLVPRRTRLVTFHSWLVPVVHACEVFKQRFHMAGWGGPDLPRPRITLDPLELSW